MKRYIVSARKYRPSQFKHVCSQNHVTNTLQNSIKNNKLAQAFLFCGPRGVGKTSCARILAKAINCHQITDEFEACGKCKSCISFCNNTSFNIHELDAASNNSVEDIRNLVEQIRYRPQNSKYKVYIIDEVHMLSNAAFNAFLKTLEEPPSYAIFILATTEKNKIIPTILSRCQIFDFNSINSLDIKKHLIDISHKESIKYEEKALDVISDKAQGSLRDALSMFDRISSFTNDSSITYQDVITNLNILDQEYFFKIIQAITNNDLHTIFNTIDEIIIKGFQEINLISGISDHFRSLLCYNLEILNVNQELNMSERYIYQAKQFTNQQIQYILNILNRAELNIKNLKNRRLHVELTILNIISYYHNHKENTENTFSQDNIKTKENKKENETLEKQMLNTEKKKNDNQKLSTFKLKTIKELSNTLQKKVEKKSNKLNTKDINKGGAYSKEPTDFGGIWNEYIEYLKKNGNYTLCNILSNTPHYENNIITIKLQNQIQKDLVTNIKQQLVSYISSKFQDNIKLNLQIEEKKINESLLYTNTEKLEYLKNKNPNILELKEKLELDIDI